MLTITTHRAGNRGDDTGLQRRSARSEDGASAATHFSVVPRDRIDRDRNTTRMIMMLAARGLLLVIVACHIIVVTPAPAKIYDQRQTGDLNVEIELKDLRVVALLNSELLDDYTDYDYFYDYADFTVKPGRPTASTTTTEATEKNNITETTELSSQNATHSTLLDNANSTERNATLTNLEEIPNADQSNGTTVSVSNVDNSQEGQSSEEDSGSETVTSTIMMKPLRVLRSQKRCKSGYVPNGDGRCRRESRPWLSLLP